MGYITGQLFQESVDDAETLFTVFRAFELDSIQVFQGAVPFVPEAILEISTTQVRILDPDTPTVWTVDATANTLYSAGHSLAADTIIVLWSTTRGGLPSGLVRSAMYYVLAVDVDKFQVSLTLAGAAVTFSVGSTGTLYFAEPEAPLISNGTLYFNASILGEVPESSTVVGFWLLSDWKAQYAALASLTTVQDVLTDADEMIQDYVTEASYTLAETLVVPYHLFRRVIGELAFFYLMRRPGGLQQIKSSTKSYGDTTKKMTQQYDVSASALMETSERIILSQLIAYRKPSEEEAETTLKPMTHTWGTGRHFGLSVADLWEA